MKFAYRAALFAAAIGLPLAARPVAADAVYTDDVVVQGSVCVGQSCENGEDFGFDTIRLKGETNTVHFIDTSNSASFPKKDWRWVSNAGGTASGAKPTMSILDEAEERFVIEGSSTGDVRPVRVTAAYQLEVGRSSDDIDSETPLTAAELLSVLTRLKQLAITEFTLSGENDKHVGFSAEAFYALFPELNNGGRSTSLDVLDLIGVGFASVLALQNKLEQAEAACALASSSCPVSCV